MPRAWDARQSSVSASCKDGLVHGEALVVHDEVAAAGERTAELLGQLLRLTRRGFNPFRLAPYPRWTRVGLASDSRRSMQV